MSTARGTDYRAFRYKSYIITEVASVTSQEEKKKKRCGKLSSTKGHCVTNMFSATASLLWRLYYESMREPQNGDG